MKDLYGRTKEIFPGNQGLNTTKREGGRRSRTSLRSAKNSSPLRNSFHNILRIILRKTKIEDKKQDE